jgi:hypothetical protein
MTTIFNRGVFGFQVVLIAFFGSVSTAQSQECKGTVSDVPKGLVEVKDDALLTSAIGLPTKGALCTGKVFKVTQPITVYRVYDASKAYTLNGRWWSFSVPKGPREQYARENAICPEWSPLNIVSSCTIKVDTNIVVGPGQSAQCADPKLLLPASPVNQVYIPNDSRNSVLFVENCTTGMVWP